MASKPSTYEYLLFGGIYERQLDCMLDRLRGLCDHNHLIQFKDREIFYGLKSGNSVVRVRVRQSLDDPNSAPWHMIYSGQLENNYSTVALRTTVISPCSQSLLGFLDEMGFVAQTEVVLKGFIFKKGLIKATVMRLFQIPDSGDVDKADPISDNYLVELSASSNSPQDSITEELKQFAEQLKPIVFLDKFDGTAAR